MIKRQIPTDREMNALVEFDNSFRFIGTMFKSKMTDDEEA